MHQAVSVTKGTAPDAVQPIVGRVASPRPLRLIHINRPDQSVGRAELPSADGYAPEDLEVQVRRGGMVAPAFTLLRFVIPR